jgi:sirohydrochlorin ferrochelatase
MDILLFPSLALLSLLFGVFLIGYLTAHPLRMSLFLFATTISLIGIILLISSRFHGPAVWTASSTALICAIAGYLLAARNVLNREDSRSIPKCIRKVDDPGLGHTAVIYFTHGEPETYDPIGWLNQFREFDEQKIPFVPFFARPFFLFALRQKYLQVGKSDHRSTHSKMIKSLEEAFRRQGDTSTQFYLSFLDDHPRPDAAAITALNEGASRLVVSEVFLTNSNHTAEGIALIQEVMENFKAIPVLFTGPLYDSITLQSMLVRRAAQYLDGTDKSKIGILLVGHGQPDEWDKEWPTETEQEIRFRLDVLKQFELEGYAKENMSLAWMEFKEPKPKPKIEAFVKNGVEKLLYFPAAISADSIHSQYDIPDLVHKAKVPPNFPMINLGAWNDDPIVIEAIKEKIDAALENFEGKERRSTKLTQSPDGRDHHETIGIFSDKTG